MSQRVEIFGGCHCSTIRFKALVSPQVTTLLCNCSICRLTGFEHLIVPHAEFTLLCGQENLLSYQFGTKKAEHLFCKVCGVKSFYQPRSHPEAFSVHVAALDNAEVLKITQKLFDGQNWEQAKSELHE